MKKMNDPDNKRFYSKVLTYFSFGLMFCALGLNLFSREGIVWVTTNPDYIEALYVIPFVTYAIFFSMMRECCMIGLQIMKKTPSPACDCLLKRPLSAAIYEIFN